MSPVALLLALRLTIPADSSLDALYASGVPWDRFLATAEARKAAWERNWENARVPDDVLIAARALSGRWRLLIIAVDGCSDSVNTVPYLARLSVLAPQIELRIISPDAGRALQEAHRTPDGRAATPTVILLDDAGRDVGAWVERPTLLQQAGMAARAAGAFEQYLSGKQAWYDRDAGASTVREVVALLTAASAATRPLPSPAGHR